MPDLRLVEVPEEPSRENASNAMIDATAISRRTL
jgi:hypothetical protein